MQKKQTILVVASLLVVVLSVTLAYFTAQIIGKGKSVTINSADLQIIFTDTDGSISGTNIEPGWSTTKKFTIKNNSNATYKYNIVIQNLVNTFVTEGYLQYKITSDNGGFSTTDYTDVPKGETATDTILGSASIEVGLTQTYTIEFIYKNDENIDQSADMNKKLSGTIFIIEKEEEVLTLYDKILEDNPTISERTDFSTAFTTNTANTLYKATENGTDVYYFAGQDTESTPINNWVKFGGYFWRIIRTNHDRSIRLLYSGTSPEATSVTISEGAYNSSYNSPKYVGYMYGDTDATLDEARTNTNDSTIKTFIDEWYQNYLTNYTKYLSNDAVYCNDRELASGNSYSTSSNLNFKSYNRLDVDNNGANASPTYDCTNNKDAFSGSNAEAKLKYPIALMTADEISFAGGVVFASAPMWYYTNGEYSSIENIDSPYLLTPVAYESGNAYVWQIDTSDSVGSLGIFDISAGANIRPVTSLKSCVKYISGDGTPSNPYTILETETGC